MLGELLRNCFVLPCRSTCGLSPFVARPWLPESSFPLQRQQRYWRFLIEWINRTLKEEHIVVKSLEEDLYDGLVLHHLLGSLKLDVDKIALTERKQRQKLTVIMEAVAKCLQLEESQLKWSVESILAKDLLSTLHLLVAIAKHFEPSLALPPNVQVETITIEVFRISVSVTVGQESFHKANVLRIREKGVCSCERDICIFCELHLLISEFVGLDLALLQFVNQHVGKLGLNVKDITSQFSDGVILLLLIGQLEGYFLNLWDFFLTPASTTEMVGCYLLHTDEAFILFPTFPQ
uniref:Parvin gamma n=1 Tax=Malurus cyaneus samueli TaxID=2593467 RepID=A0A8C5TBB7_9PASS